MTALEEQGIPGVIVASSEFRDAARYQAQSLGFEPVCVFVPHPIQDRTDQEIRDLADAAMDEILKSLTVTDSEQQA